jgi:hypothetical protein
VRATEFRRLALSLPAAVEGAHMGHADFRVGGRIFATLGHPSPRCAVAADASLGRHFLARFVVGSPLPRSTA